MKRGDVVLFLLALPIAVWFPELAAGYVLADEPALALLFLVCWASVTGLMATLGLMLWRAGR